MKKLLSLLLVALLVLPAAALADEVVNVFNWYDYIDESVFAQFTEETGIQVNDMYFTTNEEMLVQVEANPGAFDVCFPSEYIVERMLEKDLLAEINYDNVPNFQYTLESLSLIHISACGYRRIRSHRKMTRGGCPGAGGSRQAAAGRRAPGPAGAAGSARPR